MFDLKAQETRLARLPDEERQHLCGQARSKWPWHKAVTTVMPPKEGYGTDSRMEPFAHTVMLLSARVLAFEDELAHRALWRLLNRWANGEAMTKIKRDPVSAHYAIDRALLPAIVGLSIAEFRGVLDQEQHDRVVAWLHRVVEQQLAYRASIDPDDVTARNNHALLNAGVMAAWGALQNRAELMAMAIEHAEQAIALMRKDGSFPLETKRGARALWYQRHAVASLVTIAEIAAHQGIDLYDHKNDGRSIHKAIEFLIRAVEDPEVVLKYAKTNFNPGPFEDYRIQDMGFMRPRGHGRHYMAWTEIYTARFPEREESKRLNELVEKFANDFRPMVDDYSGGNTSCFFARVR